MHACLLLVLIGIRNNFARRSLIRTNASLQAVPYQLTRFVRAASNISGNVDWPFDFSRLIHIEALAHASGRGTLCRKIGAR
jgi:hypothetical protein